MHEVDIGVKLDRGGFGTYEYWVKVNDVLKSVAGEPDSAGTGFGVRDMQWQRESFDEAKKLEEDLVAACKKAGLEVEYSSTYEMMEEEE